jgi:hypothetical protein
MHIQNNYIIISATSQNYIWYPIANRLFTLNNWFYCVVYKITCSRLMIFISFYIEKINPQLVQCLFFLCFVARASCVNLWIVNQLEALIFSNIFICLSLSTCFGHYVPIIRRDPITLTQLLYLSYCEKSLVSIKMLYKLNSDIIIIMCYIYIYI